MCNTAVFESVVRREPKHVAVISRRGILTYNDLNVQANRLAHHLWSIGVEPETVVAVSLERGIGYIVAMFAIWKAGAAYLPLDVAMPHERMKYMISQADAHCLITTTDVARKKSFQEFPAATIFLDDVAFLKKLRSNPSTNPEATAGSNNLAYIFYTSGTSGKPKGVSITHGSIINMADDVRQSQEITPTDRVLLFSPFCFDASIRDIHGALLLGATLYVPDEDEILPGNLVDTLQRQAITYAVVTPSVLRACKPEGLPALRTIVVAGEAPSRSLIRTWGSTRTLINAYGPTEATVCSAKRIYHDGWVPPNMPVTVGIPILNTRIDILDEDDNRVAIGCVGEICISGPGVSRRGYLNLPELSAKCFKDDFFPESGRSYRTGDLGRTLLGGEVEFLGRKDAKAQIKLHGQRIESEEIENVLRTHQDVSDAVVVLRGSEGHRILAAYVVPATPSNANLDLSNHLDALLREHLPSYSIPSVIRLIEAIPVQTTQKLDYDSLPDPIVPASRIKFPGVSSAFSGVEAQVRDALIEALHLPRHIEVSPETTFAELGGTSLLASSVLGQLNKTFGSKLLLSHIYRRKMSIRNIADLIGFKGKAVGFLPNDLLDRAVLPHDILPTSKLQDASKCHRALLTGATGFLGAHILAGLLDSDHSVQVTCIVRAKTSVTASNRVRGNLQAWGVWKDAYASRIAAIPGDIGRPFMGLDFDDYWKLAEEIDVVWHSAAEVNFIAPYENLEHTNVKGCIEILRFTTSLSPKRLVYVSTLAVFFGAGAALQCGTESNATPWATGVVTGYAQTKWVAEQLMMEFQRRGGHVLICRPARLLGTENIGKCPRDDLTVRLIASFIALGLAPDLEWEIDLTPVDACAKAIIDLASQKKTGIHHFINHKTMPLHDMVTGIRSHGFPVRFISYHRWKEAIQECPELNPLASLFTEPVREDGSSAFDLLLSNTTFRTSAYSTSIIETGLHNKQLLACPESSHLLKIYLWANFLS